LDLEQLKHRNSSATQALEQPYQPIIYAIPKAQWEAMMALMVNNLPFIDTLATEEGLETYYEETSKSLIRLTGSLDNYQREMSSQAGKMQDEFGRQSKELGRTMTNWQEDFQKKTWKRLSILIGAQTIFLSLLTILLTWILR